MAGRQQSRRFGVFDEVVAPQQLHRDIGPAAILACVIYRDDVRVRKASRHFSFAEKFVAGLVQFLAFLELLGERNDLERHVAVDHRIACAIDDAHGTFAQFVLDLVTA